MKQIHYLLNQISILHPLLKTLAFIKSDLLKPSFEEILIKKMVNGWSKMRILDLGCGSCYKERDKRFWGVDITCVDIYQPYLQICQKYGFKTLQADIRYIGDFFPKKSVDIIWFLDVIEHLRKKDGIKVLTQAEEIARSQVIIFSPLGMIPQDVQEDNNPYQKHLSGWSKNDFEKRGYRCQIIKDYHYDIRKYSKKLSKYQSPISADAIWATKTLNG